MTKFSRYQGEADLEALAMRVYHIKDRASDQTKLGAKTLAEANPQLAKMRDLSHGAPIVVPPLKGEKERSGDHFDEARDALAAVHVALEKLAKSAAAEAQKRNEILKQPEVKKILMEAKLDARAEAARVDAEVRAKTMKAMQDRAGKAVEKLRAQVEELAKRRPG
jgi:hypothetical protein